MKVYLAGPMRGIHEFNFPAFHAAAAALRAEGHEVFSPAENDIRRNGGVDPSTGNAAGCEHILKATHNLDGRTLLGDDCAWICANAEAVALMPGWEFSKGATAEKALADALNIQTILLPGKPPVRNTTIDAELAKKIAATTELVREELVRARAKYGSFRGFHEAWGVIEEEWIELQNAIIGNDPKKIAKEAIQVAAMATSLVADLC